MNYFTKEELIEIMYLADYYIGMNITVNDEVIALREKLQVLTDNYCEHTDRQYYSRANLYECNECKMVGL
jgi:hypothetical protein